MTPSPAVQELLISTVWVLLVVNALLGLFSLITLFANRSARRGKLPVRQSAWYTKESATFSDALALVRQCIWRKLGFSLLAAAADISKLPKTILERITQALCYASA